MKYDVYRILNKDVKRKMCYMCIMENRKINAKIDKSVVFYEYTINVISKVVSNLKEIHGNIFKHRNNTIYV